MELSCRLLVEVPSRVENKPRNCISPLEHLGGDSSFHWMSWAKPTMEPISYLCLRTSGIVTNERSGILCEELSRNWG
jgi:hypothetical protein